MSTSEKVDAIVKRHPLQRMASPSRQASLLLHVCELM
jgi:hypothetical protein